MTVAGKVIVHNKTTDTYETRLVHVERPIMRIPNLAIHLNRSVNSEGFKLNTETHLIPVNSKQCVCVCVCVCVFLCGCLNVNLCVV